jgi:hypothetical protein
MTLASKPVLGGQCAAASAFSSLNGSHQTSVFTCAGKSPTAWESIKNWPDPYHGSTKPGAHGYSATAFHCPTTGLNGTTFYPKSMMEVMSLADDGSICTLGRYIGAALLNARSGLTPVLNESNVRGMWNGYIASGYFQPAAGIKWGAAEIVAYIKTTLG